MPVYVYRNLRTGETFEVEQRMTESALTQDPTSGDPVKRLIQPVGIAFKGSGFYVTDSRSNGKRNAPGTNGSNGRSEAGASEAKAEGGSSDAAAALSSKDSSKESSKESGSSSGASAASTKPTPAASAPKA